MAKLDKSIKIGNTEYEVQATVADKVVNPLTIQESIGFGTEDADNKSTTFTGEMPKTISVVSATEGGYYKKPIYVPSVADLGDINGDGKINYDDIDGKAVVNYGDLTQLLAKFTGAGWYSWSWQPDPKLESGGIGEFKTTSSSTNVAQHVGIVTGSINNRTSFAKANNTNKYLPLYFYLATDGDYGFYWGTSNDTTISPVVQRTYDADKANYALVLSDGIYSYSPTSLQSALAALGQSIQDNTSAISKIANGTDGTSNSKVSVKYADALTSARNIIVDLDSNAAASFNGTSAISPGVKDILQPANGGTGKSSLTEVHVGKATADAENCNIRTNYYRHASNVPRKASETGRLITISNSDPNNISEGDHGQPGDIWIVYN